MYAPDYQTLTDAELAQRARAHDAIALRLITTRNNQRLYRAAWSILKNRADAEEAVQDGYIKAFGGVARYEGRASLSTWLTRIVVNEALQRRRAATRRKRSLEHADIAQLETYRESLMSAPYRSPELQAAHAELGKALEAAIRQLPDAFRMVLVLRDIEGMSVEDTATALGVQSATVKTRHLRARRRLREALDPDFRAVIGETLRFDGANCERMTERAVAAICGRQNHGS
jgi:RNA polymerase sigma-70 factor (ECF subfamily)